MNRLAVILGIRPDVIRASLLLRKLASTPRCDLKFIWTGQHYSDNLKDIFFRELQVPAPDIELNAGGSGDADVVGTVISRLGPVLEELKPAAAVFLGDTNTVMGCIAAAQLNIPIVHIEGCMRSYDWRMPEEKYRTVSDHLSDVIYAYLEEYKQQGVAEGLNSRNIVTVGNPIVDVLEYAYFGQIGRFHELATEKFFQARGIKRYDYYLMTCHRRENVDDAESLARVFRLVEAARKNVYFPAGYRTQRRIQEEGLAVPSNAIIVDPVGYDEFLTLLTNSRAVFTDSGTVVEEACVLQVPSIQMRRSTERPQVYDVGASVKFDPGSDSRSPQTAIALVEGLYGHRWSNPFGDGQSSGRIFDDLIARLEAGRFAGHTREQYHLPVDRSYKEDKLEA